LVELRKTVVISAVYDDGVSARDVYSVLDDGGCNENVIFVVDEVEHHSLHLLLVQLTVSDGQPRLRHETLDERCDGVDRLDAIVNEKDLPTAREFEIDRRLDHAVRELHHLRLNREPVARCGLDQRHVAHAAERHVQRAWNGRRRKRQHVDTLLQLLEPLLVGHSETLLFVDDAKSEIFEANVFGEHAVRADHYVYLA